MKNIYSSSSANYRSGIPGPRGETGSQGPIGQPGSTQFNGLTDVELINLQNNQLPIYDNVSNKWKNRYLNSTDINTLSNSYYETVYTFSTNITASPNKYYILNFGGNILINPLNVGEHIMISAVSNQITINFSGTSFLINSELAGSISNPTIVLLNCTIELNCVFNSGQTYYNITRVSQNATSSVFTINGVKYSSLNKLENIPNININSPNNNDVLTYNNGNWINAVPNFTGVTSFNGRTGNVVTVEGDTALNQLSDVVIVSPSTNQAVLYNGSIWTNSNIPYPVTSVFGRTGIISAQANDYNINQLAGVSITSPLNGQVLSYNGINFVNSTPTAAPVTSVFGRTGIISAQTNDYNINQLAGVSITSPLNNQVLRYNGTNWVNGSAPVTSVFGRTGIISAQANDYNINQLAGVSITSPINGQILRFNGTNWINVNQTTGPTALSELSDIFFNTLNIADYLYYDGTSWTNRQVSQLANPFFVNIFNPVNGQVLINNGTQWINSPWVLSINTGTSSNGQVIKFNGTQWVNANENTSFIFYNSQTNLLTNNYFRPGNGIGVINTGRFAVPRLMTITSISMLLNAGSAVGSGWTFTLTRNGVSTGLSVTCTSNVVANRITGNVTFNQFESLEVLITVVGTGATTIGSCTLEYI